MSELYFMTTITNRSRAKKFIELYQKHGVDVTFSTLGDGTAVSETLDSLGLEQAEKVIIFSIVTRTTWKKIKASLEKDIKIDGTSRPTSTIS